MSKIEWTEKTWNPIRGCSIVSPGCVNCYAMRQAQQSSLTCPLLDAFYHLVSGINRMQGSS